MARAGAGDAAVFDVVGLGECSIDHLCLLDGHPTFGDKVALRGYAMRPGGSVATAVLACARLGLRAAYVGCVGEDPAAEIVLEPLREAGVDLSHVQRVADAPTRLAVVLVDRRGGERTVLGYRDPRLRLAGDAPPERRVRAARALLLDDSDPPASLRAAQRARAAGVPVILDVDVVRPGIEELLRCVDFPIVSRSFAESWGKGRGEGGSLRATLRDLVEKGARMAGVTLGERGVLALAGERELAGPAFAVEAVDTTGAGDAFHAGFAWALLEGCDLPEALRRANAVAALSCLGSGAQGGLPTREQVERFLAGAKPGLGPSD